ncbi:MAG: hypothetical protein KAH32_06030 [Chlamydiia bacterium]|nr:hypothetical protein [Chlamydiia bacterium]
MEEHTVDSLFDDDDHTAEVSTDQEGIDNAAGSEGVEHEEEEHESDNETKENESTNEEGEVGEAGEEQPLTGVEKFLTDFGVTGGMISYEDGEEVNFYDLNTEEQYNILQELSTNARPDIEEEYDLDSDEIHLLNDVRNSGLSIEEYIGSLINDQVEKNLLLRDAVSVDYEEMPADAIYLKWLHDINPEMEQEEAIDTLEEMKKNPTVFNGQVNSIRGQYRQSQQVQENDMIEKERSEQSDLVEADRYEIVRAVENLDSISGAEITPDMKNEVLHSLLEINDQGDPLIMEEMFSDPEKLFKAAWFIKYGEGYMDNVDRFWRRKESESYKRGRTDVLNGAPESPNGMARNNVIPRPGTNSSGGTANNAKPSNVDALWED